MAALVPVLRAACDPPQSWAAAVEDRTRGLVRRAVAPGLHELLAFDDGRQLRFVTLGEVDDPGAWFTRARANLDPTAGLRRTEEGLWALESPDGLAASRLLLPRFLDAFTEAVGGRPVAMVPHARAVWVGSEAQAPLLLELAERAWQAAGTPVSPALYVSGPRGLEVWRSEEHQLALTWAWCALSSRVYRRVGEALSSLFEQPRFASTKLLRGAHGWELVSALAPGAAPVLVPQCHRLLVHRQEAEPVLLDAAALARQEGWQAWPGLDPPWWLVRELPALP